jgi:hypothetical protein
VWDVKPKDTRKAIAAANDLCNKRGIGLQVMSSGKGSHQALIFTDLTTSESVKVVIAGGSEIGAGVQRKTLRYLKSISSALRFAEVVREILAIVFGGSG